jgi:hypothetical protein
MAGDKCEGMSDSASPEGCQTLLLSNPGIQAAKAHKWFTGRLFCARSKKWHSFLPMLSIF